MAKKIYLNGGADIMKGESKEIDTKALSETENKRVFVLNLTTNDQEKIDRYREFFKTYFTDLNVGNINFASELDNEKIKEEISKSDLLYIPGGDTEILIKNVKEKELVEIIKSFRGIIMGVSAGAMMLCDEAICAYENREPIKGLGLVDILIDVHYNEKHNDSIKKFFNEKDLYAIPEKSIIIVQNGELKFIGDVYLFSKGEKTKVN